MNNVALQNQIRTQLQMLKALAIICTQTSHILYIFKFFRLETSEYYHTRKPYVNIHLETIITMQIN